MATRFGADTPGPHVATLEQQLEAVIDASHEDLRAAGARTTSGTSGSARAGAAVLSSVPLERAAKRARRSSAAEQLAGAVQQVQRTPAGCPRSETLDPQEILVRLQESYAASEARLSDLACQLERGREQHRVAESAVQQALAALPDAQQAVPDAEAEMRLAKEHMDWLINLTKHCEKAKTQDGNVFKDWVLAEFDRGLASFRQAREFQDTEVQEAELRLQRAHAEVASATKRREESEAIEANARDAVRKWEAESKTTQCQRTRLAEYIEKVKDIANLYEQAKELMQSAKLTEAASIKATEVVLSLSQQSATYNAWATDLSDFFQGRGIDHADAVMRGLQPLLSPHDPLPAFLKALFEQFDEISGKSGVRAAQEYIATETVLGIKATVGKHLETLAGRLDTETHAASAAKVRCDAQHQEAVKQMQLKQTQFTQGQALLSKLSQWQAQGADAARRRSFGLSPLERERGA